jgi:serine/threonine-protein kinase
MRAKLPTPEAIERFLREAKIQARLDHPAIAPVHELGHDRDGLPYFTMKRLAGTTMTEAIHQGRAQQRLLRAFVDVCLAIELAHTKHVVHRDLKPANVMLGDYGEVYVLDWGIARIMDEAAESSETDGITERENKRQPGTLLGTPGYMAPEQGRGAPCGPATDVYALGCILFEILVGAQLHPSGLAGVSSAIDAPTVAPSSRAPNVPPELDAACVAALAAEPTLRPAARELGARVQSYLDGDRDVERRRSLSADFLAQATAATGHTERMRLAGRALALDPESQEAAALVTRMMLEPPDEIPPELERRIEARDVEYVARSSWVAVGAIACLFVFLPFLFLAGVTNVPVVVGSSLLLTLLLLLTYVQARSATAGRQVNVYPSFIGAIVVIATFSRICGPFVFVPLGIVPVAVSVITNPQMLRRPVVAILICVMGFVVPLVLEALGVLGPTWHVGQDQFVFLSTIVHLGGVASEVFLIGAPILCIVIAGAVSWALAMARRDAVHQLELQSWRLMQLVPESLRR